MDRAIGTRESTNTPSRSKSTAWREERIDTEWRQRVATGGLEDGSVADEGPHGEPPSAPRPARAKGRGRRLLGRGTAAAAPERGHDVQGLLTQALEVLVRDTRSARAAVWVRDAADRAALWAAQGEVAPPSEEAFALLAGLATATDLGAPETPAPCGAFARTSGLSAAAPVLAAEGAPLALLLLGGPEDPPGAVRPRTLAALAGAAARLAGPLAATTALSRLARLDAEVRRLDRLAALGELVAEIVHEIRNPLVSVKTFLQLLPERIAEPEFRDRFREVAAEELRRIERLLDLVLAHARPGTPPREGDAAALGGACRSVAQLVAHRAADLGVAVEVLEGDEGLRVALSADALRQVVLNLVLNALDATPSGGRVRLRLDAADGTAELCVEDEGPGIPEALRERVFEPFFSSKPEAPGGLGLAISRRIVEEAGGRIAAEATAGGGGCFRVSLPRV
jgi:signal transduction histidine kinase